MDLAAKMHDMTRFHTFVERTSGSSDRLDRCDATHYATRWG
jgi:hypothetical protein